MSAGAGPTSVKPSLRCRAIDASLGRTMPARATCTGSPAAFTQRAVQRCAYAAAASDVEGDADFDWMPQRPWGPLPRVTTAAAQHVSG
jgi:hypothetical protein